MSVKQLFRSAAVAWCPSASCGFVLQDMADDSSSSSSSSSPHLLALGTMGVDPRLELARVDVSSVSASLPVLGSVGAPAPFQCLTWGLRASGDGGLLAGGMAEGEVTLWDARHVLKQGVLAEGEEAGGGCPGLLAGVSVQRGQRVQCLQFSSLKRSLLAAGCSGGGVSVLDVSVVEETAAYQPGADAGDADEEVTCLAWNVSVPHILATGTGTGQTVVWDLKQRKHAISFCDPQHRHSRPSSVLWLPSQPTQLLLVYDDDRNPSPQLWDLRNASFPLREAQPQAPFGHARGIVHASLSPTDSRLVLTCGRDSRLVCWWLAEEAQQQQHSGGIEVYLQQQTAEPYMQVLWSPLMAGVYAATTPVRVSVRSLLAGGTKGQGGDSFYGQEDGRMMGPTSSSLLPSWFKEPRCLDFGFGDRLAFSAASSRALAISAAAAAAEAAAAEAAQAENADGVVASQEALAETASLAAEVQQLDGFIRQQQWRELCVQQLQQQEASQQEQAIWTALLDSLEGRRPSLGGCSREELLQQLETILGKPVPSVLEQRQQQQMEQQQQQQMMMLQQQQQMQQQQQVQPMYGAAYGMQQQQQQQQHMNGCVGYPGYPLPNGVTPQQRSSPPFSAVDPEKFFSQLGGAEEETESPKEQQQQQQQELDACPQQQDMQQQQQQQEKEQEAAQQAFNSSRGSSQRGDIDWTTPAWQLLRECLLSGCVEGAAELLKEHGSLSDALLLAGAAAAAAAPPQLQQQQQTNSGCLAKAAGGLGLNIWQSVAQVYVQGMQDDFFKLFGFAALDQLEELVECVGLSSWREAFRLLSSYAGDGDAFQRLARRLGERLAEAGDLWGALFCFVSTKDFPEACKIWLRQLQQRVQQQASSSSSSSSRNSYFAQQLLSILKKMLVLRAASGHQGPCSAFERIVLAYADQASGLCCGMSAMLVLRLYLEVGSGAAAAAGRPGLDPSVAAAALELASRLYHNDPTAMQQAGFSLPQLQTKAPAPGLGGMQQQPLQQQQLRQQQQQQPLRPLAAAQQPMQQRQQAFMQPQQQQQQRVPPIPPPLPGQQPPRVSGLLPGGAAAAAAAPTPAASGVPGADLPGRFQGYLPNGQPRQQQQQPTMLGGSTQPQLGQQQQQQQPLMRGFSQGGGSFGQPPVSSLSSGAFGGSLPPPTPHHPTNVGAPPSLVPSGSAGLPAAGAFASGGSQTAAAAAAAGGSNAPPMPVGASVRSVGSSVSSNQAAYGGSTTGAPPSAAAGEAGAAPPPLPAPYTAPTVGAQPVKPGMPVPWPIPTSAQLNQRATRSTYAANVGIHKASEKAGDGKALPPDQQAFVSNVLKGLIQAQQGPLAQDISNRIDDLLLKLQQGELSTGASEKAADSIQAQRLHAELSATEWHASNRPWSADGFEASPSQALKQAAATLDCSLDVATATAAAGAAV
ncbi:hypothetical protein Esti_003543 [Eimeria stiedai]